MRSGWYGDRHRHYLAAKGIKTAQTKVSNVREKLETSKRLAPSKRAEEIAKGILEEEEHSSKGSITGADEAEHRKQLARVKQRVAKEIPADEGSSMTERFERWKDQHHTGFSMPHLHAPHIGLPFHVKVVDEESENIRFRIKDDKPEYIKFKVPSGSDIAAHTKEDFAQMRQELRQRADYIRNQALPDLKANLKATREEARERFGPALEKAKEVAKEKGQIISEEAQERYIQAKQNIQDEITRRQIEHYEKQLRSIEDAEFEYERKLKDAALEADSEYVSNRFTEMKKRQLIEEGVGLRKRELELQNKLVQPNLNFKRPKPAGYNVIEADVNKKMAEYDEERRRRFGG